MSGDQETPAPRVTSRSSRRHLAWAVPASLGVILFCAFVGLLRWCGDGQAETCGDPVRTSELYGDAVRWIIAGALGGGIIIALAPWGPVRARLIAGAAVVSAVIGAGLLYLAL